MWDNIYRSLRNYRVDFGLARTSFFIVLYCLILFGTTYIYFEPLWYLLFPLIVGLFLLFFRNSFIGISNKSKFVINIICPTLIIIFGYMSIGDIDRFYGGLARMDEIGISFDSLFSSKPLAVSIQDFLAPYPVLSTGFYDLLMISYISYYLIPLIGALLLYRGFGHFYKHKIGQYIFGVTFFYIMNFTFYLLIPITGPQYFQKEYFTDPLPFSALGQFFYELVQNNHFTLIDCFPSGHFGICLLVTLFLYRWNNIAFLLMGLLCFFVSIATIALRYHYLFDLFASLFLVFLSYKVSVYLYPLKTDVSLFRDE